MPRFVAKTESITLGYIVGASEEPLYFDIGSDFQKEALWLPEVEGIKLKPDIKISLPLYEVMTIPGHKNLKNCLPIFPMGCSVNNHDTFTYQPGELVIVMFTSPEGYPLILGSVPVYAKDKARNDIIPRAQARYIKVGDSEIRLEANSLTISKGYCSIFIDETGIRITTDYVPIIELLKGNRARIGTVEIVPEQVVVSNSLEHSGSLLTSTSTEANITTNRLTTVANTSNLSLYSVNRTTHDETSTIADLEATVEKANITFDNVSNEATPKLTITLATKLEEDGGITIQKKENSAAEVIAKAETLKQQLDLLIQWLKTHTHPFSGAPPSTPPLDFTEDWFSELIKTD